MRSADESISLLGWKAAYTTCYNELKKKTMYRFYSLRSRAAARGALLHRIVIMMCESYFYIRVSVIYRFLSQQIISG